jgi:two-component sensor histidine kinase/CBS domain-containing protein
MEQNILTDWFSLKPAIDTRPLTVAEDMPILEAIALMGKAQSSCVLPSLNIPLNATLISAHRPNYLFVMAGSQLKGVFTTQEALKLITSGRDLGVVNLGEVVEVPQVSLRLENNPDIFTALSLLRQHQVGCLPVLDAQNYLRGVVTYASICQALQLDELLKVKPLSEAMITPVIQAPMGSSVLKLAELMVKHQVEVVVLIETANNSDPKLGLVTEGDIIQLQALNLNLEQISAQEVMTTPVISLSATDSVLVAHWKMQQCHQSPLVVSSDTSELLGFLTPTSCLQTLDLTEIYTAVEQLQRSIQEFAAAKAEVSPNSELTLQPLVTSCPSELLEQLERNRLLASMALRIRESLKLDEILNTSVTEVRQFLQSDRVIIYRFNPDLSGTVVVESVAEGWQPALGSTIKDSHFGKDYAHLYQAGRTLVIEDVYTAGLTQCHIDILVLFDIRANLVVPILQGEQLWGLLCAYHCSGPRFWREFEVDLLKQLATHIAIAIQQSELYQQVQTELAERKRAQEQLKASLKEKEVLLKEIHHRVKNNLQIISSLLKLQSSYVKDEQGLTMFKDSQNRIRSMALIHEKLYQSQDLSRIDFAEYIRDLTSTLLRSYKANAQEITLKTQVNNIWLNVDTAIPCGLIINELISNCLKHAFPSLGNKDNKICIKIDSSPDNQFTLVVSDNGIGLPPELDFQNTESLGLELVCSLAEQLEGNIELDRNHGTSFKITFAEVGNPARN